MKKLPKLIYTAITLSIITLISFPLNVVELSAMGKSLPAASDSNVTSKPPLNDTDSITLPVQPFHLFTKIDSSPTYLVEISYINYQGKTVNGNIVIPEKFQHANDKIIKAFAELKNNNFAIQKINSFQSYPDVYKALKDNATFLFATTDDRLWIVINPVNNPLIVRKAKSTSGILAIFPARGVLSVNRNYTSKLGKINPTIIKTLNDHGVFYTLQPDKNTNELFFGLFSVKNNSDASHDTLKSTDNSKATTEEKNFIFKYGPLPDGIKKNLIKTKTWQPGCPVGLDRLNYVQFGYYDFKGETHQGSLVTADVLGPSILNIFTSFYKNATAIEKPGGGAVSGTGVFNCRKVTGEDTYSLHSYGTALDLSYYRNPYIGVYKASSNGLFTTGSLVEPTSELIFIDRNQQVRGFNEEHISFIASEGLSEWGGTWLNRTDFMHFQTSPFFSYVFPLIDYKSGLTLLNLEKQGKDNILHKFSLESTEVAKWQLLFQLYPSNFAKAFVDNISEFEKLGEDEDGYYRLLYEKLQAN